MNPLLLRTYTKPLFYAFTPAPFILIVYASDLHPFQYISHVLYGRFLPPVVTSDLLYFSFILPKYSQFRLFVIVLSTSFELTSQVVRRPLTDGVGQGLSNDQACRMPW